MKATGIVRRIDDLGRVVIPKEIRRTMRIREGDPLEIYTDTSGEVIFKKYSPIGELSLSAMQYADAVAASSDLSIVICDRDHCVAAAGISKKEVIERRVTPELEEIMESRKIAVFNAQEDRFALEGVNKKICVAAPIIAAGDICGAVVLLASDKIEEANETDIKIATIAASFLAKQMEE